MDFKHIGLAPDEILGYTKKIFDTMREALVVLDEQRTVLAVNEAFYRISGLTESEVLNHSLYEMNDGQWNVEELDTRLEDVFRRNSSFKDLEVHFFFGHGDGKTVLVNARLLTQGQDHPRTALLACQDVTDLRETRQAFRTLQQELEERVRRRTTELASANAELEAFAYSVSHDLRAPLRALSGFSRALEEDYEEILDEEGRRYLQYIQDGAKKMSRLIDDLLQLSRLSRSEMQYEVVDLSRVATEILDELSAAEPERNVLTDVQEGLTVEGDEVLLTTVLRNLLWNAWKYSSREPQAEIRIGAIESEAGPVYFVQDNGVGFDMRYVDKLFQPFQRLHSEREFEGTGIGLASAYRVIRRHAGEMWAEGEEGEGATFYFTLGVPGVNHVIQGYGLGANSYIRKPVGHEELNEAVRQRGFYWILLNEAPPFT